MLTPEINQLLRNLMDIAINAVHYFHHLNSRQISLGRKINQYLNHGSRKSIQKMAAQAPTLRSLYRRFLRELPARKPSLLANPSPMQKHIRADITASPSTESSSLSHQLQSKSASARAQEAEQYLQYVQNQRLYTTLVERYNPGMNMDDEERVRLTARRVGMELPIERMKGN